MDSFNTDFRLIPRYPPQTLVFMELHSTQAAVCKRFGVVPQLVQGHDRLGIALATLDLLPINGLRIPALSGATGWYIFGGDQHEDADDFYSPLCVKHLKKYCKISIPYLCLPAGWRFQIDWNGYEDVWYDKTLLKPKRESNGG